MSDTSNNGVKHLPEHAGGRRPDRAVVVLGLLVAWTPLWVSITAGAVATMVVLGVLIAASALWSLRSPMSAPSEYTHVVLGVLLFVAPWVVGYTYSAGASWTSWIVGILVVITGLGALRVTAGTDDRIHEGERADTTTQVGDDDDKEGDQGDSHG